MLLGNFKPHQFTVLSVDDEHGVRQAVQRTIRPLGVKVLVVEDGETAIGLLQSELIHVLICDASMPGMNGIELMQQAAMTAPSVPRILLTAHANSKEVIVPAINDCAIFRVVPKPWNPLALRLSVIEALGFTADEWESLTNQTLDSMDAA